MVFDLTPSRRAASEIESVRRWSSSTGVCFECSIGCFGTPCEVSPGNHLEFVHAFLYRTHTPASIDAVPVFLRVSYTPAVDRKPLDMNDRLIVSRQYPTNRRSTTTAGPKFGRVPSLQSIASTIWPGMYGINSGLSRTIYRGIKSLLDRSFTVKFGVPTWGRDFLSNPTVDAQKML